MKKSVLYSLLGFSALMAAVSVSALADDDRHDDKKSHGTSDFGQFRDQMLNQRSMQFFGIKKPLDSESIQSVSIDTAEANPVSMVTLAKGLQARVVASNADLGANIDMMALYPQDNPTHLIVCNEQGPAQPGLQRVSLSDGSVETILTGTQSCDPVHTTAWGTIVFGEEAGNSGTILEMINPLQTTGVLYDRSSGTFSGADAGNVTERPAVGHLSFEGVVIYPNGVMYYGDENRPSNGTAGGAYFKFIPDVPWNGGAPITSLDQSPLAHGSVYGLRLGNRSGGTDYGQGSNTGRGTWIAVDNSYDADLRAAAASLKLTGYYRPEDASADEKAKAVGMVRFCANNTGNEESNRNWGETICITDGSLEEATFNLAVPEVQYFMIGNRDMGMVDNIAYQPGRGNWVLQTDRDAVGMSDEGYPFNNSIWICLEDGDDVDTLTDGCIRVINLNDLNAESTGGLFDATGKSYYFSVQHNVTGHGTILRVDGWK
ncbi:alkaline phosphatase PhoX [Nitrosomonas sp.]|uniref:alkaline phosphatase PhoX n=1 Tax=Nitrosomonas sp. TaxID=42353 RepID=UPI00284DDBDF|nr:alkaline phosphatase PhoX [Nitrosomonas sp.]MDR4513831.1 PhoX family protein [Nitrosomonas sp.]